MPRRGGLGRIVHSGSDYHMLFILIRTPVFYHRGCDQYVVVPYVEESKSMLAFVHVHVGFYCQTFPVII